MMKIIISAFVIVVSLNVFAADQIQDEQTYTNYMAALQSGNTKSILALDDVETKIMIDVFWDAQEEGLVPMHLRRALRNTSEANLSLNDRLRLAVLRHRVKMSFNRRALGSALLMGLADKLSGEEIALQIVTLRADLEKMGLSHVVTSAKVMQANAAEMALQTEEQGIDQSVLAKDLWLHQPDLQSWADGKYAQGIRIYMFCRSNRDFPCIQVIRNIRGEAVRLEDGTLWSQPALAKASRNLPSNQRNGHTPAGVHTIDSVMPFPDQVPSFGKFRRLILDFVPKSTNEQRHRALLPESSQSSSWWRPNVVARDVGRSLFRIHGTGRLNENTTASWFPFRPTSGCIAKRENRYGDTEYRDQQNLLDILMTSMDLVPKYENETAIKGLLFMIEIDNKPAPVTLEDLKAIGIE